MAFMLLSNGPQLKSGNVCHLMMLKRAHQVSPLDEKGGVLTEQKEKKMYAVITKVRGNNQPCFSPISYGEGKT